MKVILGTMTDMFNRGDRIEIRGFGSFSLNYRPPRVSHNPKSGETIHVAGKHIPCFKSGEELRERVDVTLITAPACRRPTEQALAPILSGTFQSG